ncbi:GntR family transcriptional regulator [Microvirga lotononidis]|uniref:Transcriptional regulator n=2 Tax=Microvirga lotononidis TaxID=864069 RepID=I4YUF4_9HYPH|nr:GntR family transcriptional regulator [Microvirga lotononidis]EIM27596.1 transcriptional regulator [Microvirga lotononidis]WQO28258.1 GntR family transcriptional regulator [Microvirga lotononidis]
MIASHPSSILETDENWGITRPRTLVDHAVDAIISAAARGHILPEDRISEPDLVSQLGISRVPIREALRLLESQGVVTSEPYKGIRLMKVTNERLDHIIDVRIALETLACRRAIEQGRIGPQERRELDGAIRGLRKAAADNDAYAFGLADTAFHRTLCGFARNPVTGFLWESLARQLTIIFGLATLGKSMKAIVAEHTMLRDVFLSGDVAATEAAVREHIFDQAHDIDIETVIAKRRSASTPTTKVSAKRRNRK